MATRLTRANTAATNRKKFTFSCWLKRGKLSTQENFFTSIHDGSNEFQFRFDSDNELRWVGSISGSAAGLINTKRLFKDTAAWYHIVIAGDTTQATNIDRLKLYINGEQIADGDLNSPGYPGQDTNFGFGTTDFNFVFGTSSATGTSDPFSGVISHAHFIDGTAYDASTFGSTDSTTGEWKINTAPSVTYGNNGFFILKDGNSVTDQSGNSNNFTVSTGTLTNTEDNPSNNFCTLNGNTQYSGTLSNGNLKIVQSGYDYNDRGTLGMENGKFYWELKIFNTHGEFGVCENGKAGQSDPHSNVGFYFLYNNGNTTGTIYNNVSSSSTSTITCTAFASGMIINVAYDADNQALYVGQNGTWLNSGDPTSGASKTGALITNLYARHGGTIVPFIGHGTNSFTGTTEANFGNGYFGTTQISSEGTNASGIGKFEYDVPTGYTALSTKGLNE